MKFPVFIAIDTNSIKQAEKWVSLLKDYVIGFKFGLQFFTAHGKNGIELIMNNIKNNHLFIDLKFHDIPNTVMQAIQELKPLKPHMITVHIIGGKKMLEEAKKISENNFLILGVTMLTSLNKKDLELMGIKKDFYLNKIIELAYETKISGLVCASEDIQYIRQKTGNYFKLIVPGIRIENNLDDQKRINTAKNTIKSGADYLVIGRPVTQAKNPEQALKDLFK